MFRKKSRLRFSVSTVGPPLPSFFPSLRGVCSAVGPRRRGRCLWIHGHGATRGAVYDARSRIDHVDPLLRSETLSQVYTKNPNRSTHTRTHSVPNRSPQRISRGSGEAPLGEFGFPPDVSTDLCVLPARRTELDSLGVSTTNGCQIAWQW